jgi:hypothetical protein
MMMRVNSAVTLRTVSSLFESLPGHEAITPTLTRDPLMCAVALFGTVITFFVEISSNTVITFKPLFFESSG